MAISTAPDFSGSGRVDKLKRPVAAARVAVATGASGLNSHTTCIRYFVFIHPLDDKRKKEKRNPCTPLYF